MRSQDELLIKLAHLRTLKDEALDQLPGKSGEAAVRLNLALIQLESSIDTLSWTLDRATG